MPKTVAQLLAEIDAQLPTSGQGFITAAVLRSVLDDIVNNFQVTASQINTTSGTAGPTTTLFGDNSWKAPTVDTSSGGFKGNFLTANAVVQAGTINYCDTIAGGFGVTIPPSPDVGDVICFRDASGTWDTANLSINPGANNIDGEVGSLTCNTADANFDLVWRGGSLGWSLQFLVSNITRRPTTVSTAVGTIIGSSSVLGVGRAISLTGAGTAAGAATVLGVSGSTVAANWNPSDKHADITLSGSNLIATRTGTASPDSGVRATPGRTVSHRYWELTLTTLTIAANNSGFGVSNSSHALNTFLGDDATNGLGIFADGYVQGPGIAGPWSVTLAQGDVLGFETDITTGSGLLRMYRNGNFILTINSLPPGTLYPAVSLRSTHSVAANFGGSAFVYSPPVGAIAWNAP